MSAAIHAQFKLAYSGFTLDVDLDLPGRGVTALFGHSGPALARPHYCVA